MDLPYVVTASGNSRDLRKWLETNIGEVDDALAGPGAILLRDFDVASAEQFNELAAVPLGPLLQYIEGASPRRSLGNGVYTSTEYAPSLVVSMHNELSYSHRWPARVAFFCRRPATTGGQTPIADSRAVYRRLKASGAWFPSVEYRRVMPESKGFGVAWPDVFDTEDRAEVDAYCAAAGITATWLPDGALRTRQVRPSAIRHPITGAEVWFNQAHQWHPSNSGPESEAALRELCGDDLPMNALHGDGTEFNGDELESARSALAEETTMFDWQAGDVLIIDNMLTAHGRAPFTGEREVLVAMGLPIKLEDVTAVTDT